MNRKECFKITKEFISKYGYEKLNSKTKYNDVNIGRYRRTQRTKYKNLDNELEQKKMRAEFSELHPDYLLSESRSMKKKSYRDLTKEFISKYGYEKLNSKTIYKNYKIGLFRTQQRTKYNKLKDEKEKSNMRAEFAELHPDFLSSMPSTINYYEELTKEFISKYGDSKIKIDTIYKGLFLGTYKLYKEIMNGS